MLNINPEEKSIIKYHDGFAEQLLCQLQNLIKKRATKWFKKHIVSPKLAVCIIMILQAKFVEKMNEPFQKYRKGSQK